MGQTPSKSPEQVGSSGTSPEQVVPAGTSPEQQQQGPGAGAGPGPGAGAEATQNSAIECNEQSYKVPVAAVDTTKFEGYEEPKYPEEDAEDFYTGEIPQHEYAKIISTYNEAVAAAKGSERDSTKAAKIAYETAKAEYEGATDNAELGLEQLQDAEFGPIAVAQQKSTADYANCLRDALPKNCKSDDKKAPGHKRALCVAKLRHSLAKQDLAYQKAIKKICEELADAERAWAKATEQHDAAIRIAEATKTVAEKAAEEKKYEELEKAYEASCKV